MNFIGKYVPIIILSALICVSFGCLANVDVTVKGMVRLASNCTLNEGGDMVTLLGEYNISEIGSASGREVEIEYKLTCKDLNPGSLLFKISGTPSVFDKDSLAVGSSDALAVKFKSNGKALSINDPFSFNYSDGAPEIIAFLVKDTASQVQPGDYSTSAILSLEYP